MNLKKTAMMLMLLSFLNVASATAGDANYQAYFGARTLALNGLYIAGTDGLMANIMNPASAAYLEGAGLDLNLILKIGEYTFQNETQGLFKSFREEDLSFGLGGFWKINSDWAVTLGYLPVLDYHVNWPYAIVLGSETSEVLLTFDMSNKIRVDALSFDLAYTYGMFAFGIALNAYNVTSQMSFPLTTPSWSGGSILDPAYQFSYDQEAWTYGINLGASADLMDNLRIGVLVRSGYLAELKGEAKSDMFHDMALTDTGMVGAIPPSVVGIRSRFEYPWVAGTGIIWQLNRQLILNFDLLLSFWDINAANGRGEESSGRRMLTIDFDDPVWESGMSGTDSVTGITPANIDLPNQNAIEAGIGLEFKSSDELVLRAGYRFSQTPNIPATYAMAFPTVSQHWLSIGVGFKDENYTLDATIAYGFSLTQTIDRAGNEYFYGDYKGDTFIPAVSLKYGL